MMSKYDVTYVKKVGDKTYWPKIGVAFSDEKGNIDIRLDALPLSKDWDGKLVLWIKEGEK